MRNFLAVFLFLSFFPLGVKPQNPSFNDDAFGLIVFKEGIQDPDGKLTSWNQDDDSPCTNWAGVKCDSISNRVSDLVLDGYGLSGKLGRGLLQLKFLKTLSLAKNNFSGTITLSFTQLSNLETLDLSENTFSGSIGNDFFTQCTNLISISLSRNKLSGPLPDSLTSCSSIASLNLSSNQFSGPLPPGIWSLSGLWSLDLSGNSLEGEIPESIEGLSSLKEMNLRNNLLTGQVSSGIGNCLLLKAIDLSQNSFSGGLPSSIQKLTLCSDLILGKNGFTGDVPDWIGEMRSLENLDLSENDFSGKIPASLGNLHSIKTLNLAKNGLSGSLPESIINCVNLLSVDVSRNSLTGDFPSWVFKLSLQHVSFSENGFAGRIDDVFALSTVSSRRKLLVLDISRNNLSGSIPSAMRDFDSLQVLSMGSNMLQGSIPADIGELKSLMRLDLSENQLNGSIPSEIGECAALVSVSLARNEITGTIPVSLANLTRLQTVDFSFNNLSGSLPMQLENLSNLRSFNVSHNQLQGKLPSSSFFNTIDPSSISGNPALCGAATNTTCPTVLPKPIVLDPNATDASPGTVRENTRQGKKVLSISALIAIGAAAAIVIGVIAITVVNNRVRAAASQSAVALNFSGGGGYFSRSPSTDSDSGKLVIFSGDPDFAATGTHALLNKDCELGRGGFGAVYRTILGDGHPVAIKKLTVSSLVKSQDDFEREVKKLGKAQHENLVVLHGYYWTPSLQLLIYEFISGRNLYARLHEETWEDFLSWNERFDIIVGTAKGLSHLHQTNIVHCNLKSSNILIDDRSGEPKVSDYGLARLLPMLDRYVLSSKIQSALGYMAPEFACKTVKITDKCDVYGFGILVLEIVTGKRPVEYMEDDVIVLSDMVRGALEEGRVEECIDNRLQDMFPAEEAIPVMKLGLICTSHVPSNRPNMAEVVNILELIRCPSGHDVESGDLSLS